MIFRQLDSNGDWTFGKGAENYATAEAAIDLNIKTSIRSWVGDCFWALQFGINWKQLLNIGQQKNLDSALQSLILSSYGVVSVVSASARLNTVTRAFSAEYVINTVYSRNVRTELTILAGTTGS